MVGGNPKADVIEMDRFDTTASDENYQRGAAVASPQKQRPSTRQVAVGSARGAWAARRCRLAWFPPAATSNRACDFPAHGSPTFFGAAFDLDAGGVRVGGYGATVRERGIREQTRAGQAGDRTMRFERELVLGRPCDSPGCASSANP
jgi:hypothetical protein